MFTRNQIHAELYLKVKSGTLSDTECLSLYSIQDENENGIIEEADIDTTDYIGEVCAALLSGDTIKFDVTSSVEYDLFDLFQGRFSGFVIDRSSDLEILQIIFKFHALCSHIILKFLHHFINFAVN